MFIAQTIPFVNSFFISFLFHSRAAPGCPPIIFSIQIM